MTNKIVVLICVFVLSACVQGDPLPPILDGQPIDDGGLTLPIGAPAYVDEASLLIMESYPIQVAVLIQGNLPTPCHELRQQMEIQDFGAEKRVDITLSSEADPAVACIQVLDPFEVNISLDPASIGEGKYVVYVNGELAGEFNYPGG